MPCCPGLPEPNRRGDDRSSGEIRRTQILVAVLGCSNYTYVEPTWTQTLADWLGAHVRALTFFGGAPARSCQTIRKRAYEHAQWKLAKVLPDYHTEVEHAYYSVPYEHIGERAEVRMSARMIETFVKRQLVASHIRVFKRGTRATLDAHRPANHRVIVNTTIERPMQRVEAIALSVAQVLREQFNGKRHPEDGSAVAQGILRLAQDFSPARLAAACERALML